MAKANGKGNGHRRTHRANGMPYFPAYAADWLASGTRARLTPEQRGAFWDLIFHAWLEPDGMLPDDDQVLKAYSGLGDRWEEVGRTVVERAFNEKGGRLFNRRLTKERQALLAKRRQAAKAGKKSGEARAGKGEK